MPKKIDPAVKERAAGETVPSPRMTRRVVEAMRTRHTDLSSHGLEPSGSSPAVCPTGTSPD